jgi:vancomycin permeability regulator SanA
MILNPVIDAAHRPGSTKNSSAARGIALFLGAFTLVNLAGDLLVRGFNLNLWWIDLRVLPGYVADPLLFLCGLLLVWFALSPACSKARQMVTTACLVLLLLIALGNCLTFYSLVLRGAVHPVLPVPFSLLVVAGLGLVLRALLRGTLRARSGGLFKCVAVASILGLFLPLAQMFLFGKTDYRRSADVAVVLGARVYADGRLSDALKDRVRTACELYHQRLVSKLIMSGGPGDGLIHETEGMARAAVQMGVRPEDIILDKYGLNTGRTVKNTQPLFSQMKASRILVVSHGYHLPRIKLAYQRAGIEVYTVPARETYFLRQMPLNVAREVVALWVYYLRPLAAAT